MGAASLAAVVAALLASQRTEADYLLYLYGFVFGGCCLSQYSMVVALTHDHLRPAEIIPASGTIVLLSGIVSITGPLSIAFAMDVLGLPGFFLSLAAVMLLMGIISIWRVLTIPALPLEYKTQSTLQTPITPVGSVLHGEEKEVK